jgi:hypothetical protein
MQARGQPERLLLSEKIRLQIDVKSCVSCVRSTVNVYTKLRSRNFVASLHQSASTTHKCPNPSPSVCVPPRAMVVSFERDFHVGTRLVVRVVCLPALRGREGVLEAGVGPSMTPPVSTVLTPPEYVYQVTSFLVLSTKIRVSYKGSQEEGSERYSPSGL